MRDTRFSRLKARYPRLTETSHELYDFSVRVRNAFPFGGVPMNRNEPITPFFIVGSGRSGTTLLRRILQSNSEIHIPPETLSLGSLIKTFRQHRNMPWQSVVNAVLAKLEFHPKFGEFNISLRPFAMSMYETPETQRSLAHILDSVFRYHAAQCGIECVKWGNKTPRNILFLDRIRSVFRSAQFIHVIRDGVDVASSLLKAGITKDLDAAARRWSWCVTLGEKFASAHPLQCRTIRYEDLVTNPETVVSDICGFLNIEYHPEMLEEREHLQQMGDVSITPHHSRVYDAIDSSSIGRGRRDLSREALARLCPLIDKQLRRLNYDPLPTGDT